MGALSLAHGRLARACALVGTPLVVLALWNPLAATIEGGDGGGDVPHLSGVQAAADLVGGAEASDIAFPANGGTQDGSEAPEWFAREAVSLDGARELHANADWSVVGFERDGPPGDVLASLTAEALSKGWKMAESGAAGTVTGTKEEGRCRWMAISCTAVGEETCVVVQLPGA